MFPYLDENRRIEFPDPAQADAEGLLAGGGNLSPGMLLSAYEQGAFPWFNKKPILWWSPDPRCLLFPSKMHVSASLAKVLKKRTFELLFDADFAEVIGKCASISRKGEKGTWITSDMRKAYCKLHELGYAHSVEARQNGKLAGGLYGLSLGPIFFGESMFSAEKNGSKAALAHLSAFLESKGFAFIDCQLPTDHLLSLGAEVVPRSDYLSMLKKNISLPGIYGSWACYNKR